MKILETARLTLGHLSTSDAQFILELVNDPSWLRFIGDKGVRTLEDARNYIQSGPLDMYARLGFGLYLVELKDECVPIGLCGLIKRDSLDDVDIGFAYLPSYWSKGYAYEAATAVMEYGTKQFGLKRIVAITDIDNHRSARLLEKLGMELEGTLNLSNSEQAVKLFAKNY